MLRKMSSKDKNVELKLKKTTKTRFDVLRYY